MLERDSVVSSPRRNQHGGTLGVGGCDSEHPDDIRNLPGANAQDLLHVAAIGFHAVNHTRAVQQVRY